MEARAVIKLSLRAGLLKGWNFPITSASIQAIAISTA